MTKQVYTVLSFFIFTASSISSGAASAEAQYKLVSTDKQPYVEICQESSCKKVNLPTLHEPVSYILSDLRGLNGKIIIAEPTKGGMDVNFCSEVYILTTDGTVNKLTADAKESLCNVSIHEDTIISSYRDAGKWHDVVYKLIMPSRKLIKEIDDECVGCGDVARTEYNVDNSVRNTWLVTDTKNYWEREIITRHVINDKAWLYNTPDTQDRTKMYLVKNDVVTLKKEQLSEDGVTWFYFIDYQTKNNRKIAKWIEVNMIEAE
jgi:hypothetical protein